MTVHNFNLYKVLAEAKAKLSERLMEVLDLAFVEEDEIDDYVAVNSDRKAVYAVFFTRSCMFRIVYSPAELQDDGVGVFVCVGVARVNRAGEDRHNQWDVVTGESIDECWETVIRGALASDIYRTESRELLYKVAGIGCQYDDATDSLTPDGSYVTNDASLNMLESAFGEGWQKAEADQQLIEKMEREALHRLKEKYEPSE